MPLVEKVVVNLDRPKMCQEVVRCPDCKATDGAVFKPEIVEELRTDELSIDFIFPAWLCRSCGRYSFLEPLGTQVVSRIVGNLVLMGLEKDQIGNILNLDWLPRNV